MAVRFVVVEGRDQGRTIEVPEGGRVILGRSKDVDVPFNDKVLSRRHARIEVRERIALLYDLESSNGTYVNGEQIAERQLCHGDRIKLGRHVLEVEVPLAWQTRDSEAGYVSSCIGPRPVVFCNKCYLAIRESESILDPTLGTLCVNCAGGDEFPLDMIEGFRLGEILGNGRLGPIFKAKHLSLDKEVAVKIVHSERAVDEVTVWRFVREAKIGGRLHHANIIEMYDAGCSEGHYYISMEYFESESLADRIESDGPLGVLAAVTVGAWVADALAYAHAQGVVHRNLTPRAVLIGPDGAVKLGGFGLARFLEPDDDEVTGQGEPVGTLCYMPPEQLADASNVDHRADIYGLGALLYHALAGAPPFLASSVAGILENVKRGALTPLQQARPDCPGELVTIIAHCLAHEPVHRYQSAVDLRWALQQIVTSLST